jgi:acetyl-CoA carboxylase, biotin carboxylase subunit
MFKKVLIANRGEIAVRVIRTCREMGILTVALYETADQGSLHVRLADECVRLESPAGFLDQAAILAIAQAKGVDAIHPGYGFLAERTDFAAAVTAAGITFIGPPADSMELARYKIGALARAREAGFATVAHSHTSFDEGQFMALQVEAERLGYPLVVKSCHGGRGAGERLVRSPERLAEAVRQAQAESYAVYDDRRVYLERAILPARQVNVQIVADNQGNVIHLGEREGSLQMGHRKVLEESPAPCLMQAQRERLWQTAVDLARLFHYQNVGTVEFLLAEDGQFYFTEIKARIQAEHPLTEMVTRIDLVREQIRLASGQPLGLTQQDIDLRGWAMLCRVNAEDPWHNFMPSPGHLQRVRLPMGIEVRVDTFVYSGCDVSAQYDPLLAKLTVWGPDRPTCLARLRCALEDFKLVGAPTNLPTLQQLLHEPALAQGDYTTDFLTHPLGEVENGDGYARDLAVAAAVLAMRRTHLFTPSRPERLNSGWHQDSRRM